MIRIACLVVFATWKEFRSVGFTMLEKFFCLD